MANALEEALAIREAISDLELTIYDELLAYPELVYSVDELQSLLTHEIVGKSFTGPIRSRSKVAKASVCEALGYPIPTSFQRVKPRFPGQDLDVYVQKSNNLQVWNDELSPSRRFALIRVNEAGMAQRIRVVEGTTLESLDRTGTLTSKFQAKRTNPGSGSKLVSPRDTDAFVNELGPADELSDAILRSQHPADRPVYGKVLTIQALFNCLADLRGEILAYSNSERLRGAALHEQVCKALGLTDFADTGRFPDIACQALEIKLQTAPTIDLGLIRPDSTEPAMDVSPRLVHSDSRYFVAYGAVQNNSVLIEDIVLTTGADFFLEFQLFGGLVQNRKLQIPLPRDFFDSE